MSTCMRRMSFAYCISDASYRDAEPECSCMQVLACILVPTTRTLSRCHLPCLVPGTCLRDRTQISRLRPFLLTPPATPIKIGSPRIHSISREKKANPSQISACYRLTNSPPVNAMDGAEEESVSARFSLFPTSSRLSWVTI